MPGEANTTRQMLELVILTACRSGELRHMEWQEIDFAQAIWTVPAPRMKAKVAHRVPLGPRTIVTWWIVSIHAPVKGRRISGKEIDGLMQFRSTPP